jgi:hypothetical protein
LRKKYCISKLIPYEDFYKWKEEKLRSDLTDIVKNNMVAVRKFIAKAETGATTQELFEAQHFSRKFDWQSEFLCRQFKRPGYFDLIIQNAIVCGEVRDSSYQNTYIEINPQNMYPDDLPLPEVKIVISPTTKPEDVIKIFQKNVPKIFKDNKRLLKYHEEMKKNKTKLKMVRKWYWMSLSGMSLKDIYSNDSEAPEDRFSLGALEKAVERYRKTLQTY